MAGLKPGEIDGGEGWTETDIEGECCSARAGILCEKLKAARGVEALRKRPRRVQSIFSTSLFFNNMARFVLRFVFSTGTCFQQHPSFVFRFVFGYLCSLLLKLNNFPGSFLKISISCPVFSSKTGEK